MFFFLFPFSELEKYFSMKATIENNDVDANDTLKILGVTFI